MKCLAFDIGYSLFGILRFKYTRFGRANGVGIGAGRLLIWRKRTV